MKRIAAITCLSLALLHTSNTAEPPTAEDRQLAAAIKELQAQQALIADNQAKIDAKLETLAAAVRIARTLTTSGRTLR